MLKRRNVLSELLLKGEVRKPLGKADGDAFATGFQSGEVFFVKKSSLSDRYAHNGASWALRAARPLPWSPPHLPASLGLLSVELHGHSARPDGKDGENRQKGGKQEMEEGL